MRLLEDEGVIVTAKPVSTYEVLVVLKLINVDKLAT